MNYNIIVEVRYPKINDFNSYKDHIDKSLSNDGFKYEYLPNNSIECFNDFIKCHEMISDLRCGIDYNSSDLSEKEFNERFEFIFKTIDILKVKLLERIGLRVIMLNNYDSIENANKKIKNIFNVNNKELDEIKNISEFSSLSFGFTKNEYHTKLSIAPNQIQINVSGILQNINTLNIDVDIFRNNLKFDKDTFKKEFKKYFTDINNYMDGLKSIL